MSQAREGTQQLRARLANARQLLHAADSPAADQTIEAMAKAACHTGVYDINWLPPLLRKPFAVLSSGLTTKPPDAASKQRLLRGDGQIAVLRLMFLTTGLVAETYGDRLGIPPAEEIESDALRSMAVFVQGLLQRVPVIDPSPLDQVTDSIAAEGGLYDLEFLPPQLRRRFANLLTLLLPYVSEMFTDVRPILTVSSLHPMLFTIAVLMAEVYEGAIASPR